MTIDVRKLAQNKISILQFIKINGPSLPVRISKAIDSSPLFTAAFLAELHKEQKLKMSNIRIGASPLYHLPGQESLLENFSDNLGRREKEAFLLLKESKILKDEEQTPVTRVALRSIKDFAIPIKIRMNDSVKLCWKYFLLPEEQIRSILKEDSKKGNIHNFNNPQKKSNPNKEHLKTENLISKEKNIDAKTHEIFKTIQRKIIDPPELKSKETQNSKENKIDNIYENNNGLEDNKETIKEPKIKDNQINSEESKEIKKEINKPISSKHEKENKFISDIRMHLSEKDIEIISIIEEKKKEFIAKVRMDAPFGKQDFLLTAKDKKKINENDLTIALHKSQMEKMPSLIISSGELDGKAQAYIEDYKNLIKFNKLKI